MISEMKEQLEIGISRACRVLSMSWSSMEYKSVKDDRVLYSQLQELAKEHPEEGFWKYYHRLRNKGEKINHKRVHRIYKDMGLTIKRKIKKRLPARIKEPIEKPASMNQTWSIDFMSDALSNHTKFRTFNVIDDCNREVLFIEADYSIKSSRVVWVLNHLIQKQGKPKKIRMDNGPEFIAKLMVQWSEINHIEFKYIQPGKPTQNALVERFNKTYRQIVLDAYLFDNIDEVRELTENFRHDYNHHRPHDALNGLSPVNYKIKHLQNKYE